MSRLPVLGAAYAHGRTEVTARSATNVWFEPRPEGEKAPVVVSNLPRRLSYNVGSTFPLPVGFVQNAISTYVVGSVVAGGVYMRSFSAGTSSVGPGLGFPGAQASTDHVQSAFYETQIVMLLGNGAISTAYRTTVGGGILPIVEITISGESPVSIAYLGGYFVMLMFSGRFYWSADGVTWDPLAFATAETASDGGVKILAIGNLLVVMGESTIEFWQPSGNADLPFRPVTSSVLRLGTKWQRACSIDNEVFLWGSPNNGEEGLFVLRGTQAQRISTPDMERIFSGLQVYEIGGFSLGGHQIVVVQTRLLPSAGGGWGDTWWFDVASGAWTQIPTATQFHRVTQFLATDAQSTINRRMVFGIDPVNGWHFSFDLVGTPDYIHRELITDHVVSPDLDRFTVDKVRLDFAGSGPGRIGLACSHDGGATWGEERYTAASAGEGVRGIIQFDNFGTSTQFTFRIRAAGKFLLSNLIINPRN